MSINKGKRGNIKAVALISLEYIKINFMETILYLYGEKELEYLNKS